MSLPTNGLGAEATPARLILNGLSVPVAMSTTRRLVINGVSKQRLTVEAVSKKRIEIRGSR